MDINSLRALATLLLFIAFVTVCVTVFSRKRKRYYEEASMMLFDTPEKQWDTPISDTSKKKEIDQ